MQNARQQTFSSQCHTHSLSCVQVREAYLQFMITIAKMIREDKNMSKDDSFVQEEMAKVMELETDIANVSTEVKNFSGCCRGKGWGGESPAVLYRSFQYSRKPTASKNGGGKMTCCAVSSPEISASVCIIMSTAYTATVSALVLAIFIFGSLLKQDNLLLNIHYDNTRASSLASLEVYSTLKISKSLVFHSKEDRGNCLAQHISETLLNRGSWVPVLKFRKQHQTPSCELSFPK